jgi:outer membrane protein assembly factor BamB
MWTASVPGSSGSSPAIGSDGTIYIGSDNNFFYAVNAIDGTILWTFNAGNQIQASPAIDGDGKIYFGTLGNQFFCLNHDGSQAYVIPTGGEIYSSAAVTPQGAVVFGTGDGKLYEVSKNQTVAFTYSVTSGDGIYSSPSVLSDGSIIFGANDGQLYQISSTGTFINSWSTSASILSSPVVSQGRIVFGGIDHEVYTIQNSATLATSPWPTFRATPSHSGHVQSQQLAPVISAVTPSQTYTDGAQVTLRAIIDGAGPMTYSWSFNGNAIGTIDSSLVFNMGNSLAGTYALTVTNSYGSVTSAPIVVSEGASLPPIDTSSGPGRIINLSARAYTGTGANTLIIGLIIGPGNGTKPILLRGVGPSLQARGVKTFIDDPALNLYSGTTVINSNDNWTTDLDVSSLGSQVGAAAFTTTKDAGLVANLASGGYTAHVINGSTSTGSGGVALAEFYDGSTSVDSTTPLLTNISARAHVGQGDQVLIVGFIIGGSTPVKVLIRGLGPQLTHQSVPGVITDPTLRLVNQADGSTINTNDNWGDAPNLSDIQAAFTQVGATQLDAGSKDAVILTTLSPGAYTAVISGVNGATGVGLAELFEVQ